MRRTPLTLISFAIALLVVSAAPQAGPPSAGLDFKLPKTTTLGEPAIMTATLFNTTGTRVMADFGVENQTEFLFRQFKPDGTMVRVQPTLTPATRGRTSRLVLRGATYAAAVVLDEWMSFAQPGRYEVEVEFTGTVELEGGRGGAAVKRQKRLPLEVKPRDPRRLEKRGAEWLKQISTMSQDSAGRAAASALIAMNGPVAIPYLELAASRTRSPRFVSALASRGSPEAREALDRLARHPDPDVRALAAKAIGR